jgi:hypothetical protein
MEVRRLQSSLSLKIIAQISVSVAATVILIVLNFDVIYPFYFENQLTNNWVIFFITCCVIAGKKPLLELLLITLTR